MKALQAIDRQLTAITGSAVYPVVLSCPSSRLIIDG
jgi:hypothetical protein